MRTANARAFVVPALVALALSACIVGASGTANAQFMTHMPLAGRAMMHGPITNGPMTNGPISHGTIGHGTIGHGTIGLGTIGRGTVGRGSIAGARMTARGPGEGGGRTVRIPPHHHPKLHGHPIVTETADLPVSTDAAANVVQQGGAGGGGAGNSVPRGERRFVPDEVITEFRANASPQAIAQLARRFNLTQLERQRFDLLGGTFYRWRINGRRTVPSVVNGLANQSIVALVQPNHLFVAQDEVAPGAASMHGDPAQYVLRKLDIEQAHQLATGKSIFLAVIDSAIDGAHPDLSGTIAKNFDALGGQSRPQLHGTEMAGAIAAHGKLLGIAPDVQLLAARALDNTSGKARGTSFNILKSLQWSTDNGARVINMSFAGPADPALHRMLAAAYAKDIVLVAAAGNAGPAAAPAYPGSDPDVIAVTATDADDQPFKLANHGKYIAVAAPGVDILAVAPDASYQVTTGTSVAAAHVSGVAALLLQRDPALKPAQIRAILAATAKPLGTASQRDEFGAGLVDAYRAVIAPDIKAAGSSERREQATR